MKHLTEEERRELLEHRHIVLQTQAVLNTDAGKTLFKYLFKEFCIGDLPEIGLDGNYLYDRLGSLRTGKSLFDLAVQADAKITVDLLAQVKKEHFDAIYKELVEE